MDLEVRLSGGTIRGRRDVGEGSVARFLGIRYAQAPFGHRRFAAPVAMSPWHDVRDALALGPTAPKPAQPDAFEALLPDASAWGEDCLTLNVWTPQPGSSAALPVMVWIHGGGFVTGSGGVPIYDGAQLARSGVVVVTINYRLGLEGFLPIAGAPADRGLLDILAALRWVQSEIATFGGDPGTVTLAGQSAGAMAVMTLVSMPSAQGLFRRAAAFSGGGHQAISSATARSVTHRIARERGVEPSVIGLGSVPVDALIAAQDAVTATIGSEPAAHWAELRRVGLVIAPEIDGTLLPALPVESIRRGVGADVELMIGTTRDEFTLWTVPTGVAARVDEDTLAPLLSAAGIDGQQVPAAYRTAHPDLDAARLYEMMMRDKLFRIPVLRIVEARTMLGVDTHVYEFAHPAPAFGGRLGATHASDVAFWFDNLDSDWDLAVRGLEAPVDLAARMHAALVGFVRDGDPGWPAYGPQRRVKVFGDPAEGDPITLDPESQTRQVWADLL